jgi:hypothetical protein
MRRVRLTEGQLQNVIRESVNQILNELDWKTYNNAFETKYKRMQNKDDMDEFNREVGHLGDAYLESLDRQYPLLKSIFHKQDNNEPLTPEEQEELDAYDKDTINQRSGKYKYEKGGKGYYLDDEE